MVELSNGAKIEYDWTKITQVEMRKLADKELDIEVSDAIVGKTVGMTADELVNLNPIDYYRIGAGFWKSYFESRKLDDVKN